MLARSKVVLIRHAEDPNLDPPWLGDQQMDSALSRIGVARAKGYVEFLTNLPSLGGRIDFLFAAACTDGSHRPALTLDPIAKRLGLPINTEFTAGNHGEGEIALAEHLRSERYEGVNIVICWHHKHLLRLARRLRDDDVRRLPRLDRWCENVYGRLLLISYDEQGAPTVCSYE